jgi:hypothetical protein
MFDELKCFYPLPVEGANDLLYQTKDTPSQYLELYEIRADGTLWHEEYDTEDLSEAGNWMREHPDEEVPSNLSFAGCFTRTNKRMAPCDFFGAINFYSYINGNWIEWTALFDEGKLLKIKLIRYDNQKEEQK